jgi:hypothetical protein
MKILNKRQIQNIHNKCLDLVKTKPANFFNFKKMKTNVGSCNWTDIELDYRRDLLSTAYHECVHYLYPNYSESMVKYIEKRIVNTCNFLEISYFLKLLANKLYRSQLHKTTFRSSKNKKRTTK